MTIQNQSQEKFKTLIGGQALIEGILMQGPDKRAVVVRGPEGLVSKVEPIKKRTGILTWPLIRGVVNFGSSMVNGVKALMYSADFFPEEEGEPSKFDQWLENKLGSEKLQQVVVTFSVFLGVLFSVALFFLLPTLLAGLIPGLKERAVLRTLIEGLFRIAIFLGYMILISRMKDMRRVFSYHGAAASADGRERPSADTPASALRHELPVRGRDRIDSRLVAVQRPLAHQQYLPEDTFTAYHAAVYRGDQL